MQCENYKKISSKLGQCSVLQEFGVPFIAEENRSVSPCIQCKKEWINNQEPTKDSLTSIMSGVLQANGKISLPTITEQATSLGKSLVQWAYNGFQNVPPNEAELRLNICKENKCGMYDAESGRCNACGCVCAIKSKFSHEKCPADLWPQLGPEVMNNVPQGCRSCGS